MAKRPTYTSSKQHTRVRFQPLTWSCALQCLTEQSPATQKAYLDLTIAVDRTAVPCCILPKLVVYDPDGVMDVSGGNMLLSATAYSSAYDYVRGHEWYVDGVEISGVWTEGTDYEITYDTTDELNGMLTVYKNLSAGEMVTLQYKGVFADTRTGSNIVVVSDTIELECLDAGDEEVRMVMTPNVIVWNPLRDGRLLYDYLTAKGESATYEDDGETYMRTATATILQGMTALDAVPDGYTLGYYLLGTDTEITEADDYVDSIDGLSITFDLRYMDDVSIEVRLTKTTTDEDGNEVTYVRCRSTLSLLYEPTEVVSVRAKNGCDLSQSAGTYENEVIINTARGTVESPECYYDIVWYVQNVGEGTATSSSSRTQVGTGETLSLAVDEIGMDTTTEDGAQFWLVVEATERSAGTYIS